jgi:NADPH2:quinone reductase
MYSNNKIGKMKAVFLDEIGGKLQVRDVAKPNVGTSQVLIKVQASGVNFFESQIRLGRYPHIPDLPVILGVEIAGTVVEVGSGTDHGFLNKRVLAVLYGSGGSGGYAEYAVATVGETIIIPDNVSFEEALAIPVQGLTAYFMLTESIKVSKHESIFIHAAAGGVGSIAIQLAKILGAGKVFAGASTTEKLELARSLGADALINYADADWEDQVRAETNGNGVDVVLSSATDNVGKSSFALLAPFGRFVSYGSIDVKSTSFEADQIQQLIFNNQSLIGFYIALYAAVPGNYHKAVNYLLHLISTGALKIITDSRFTLTEAQQAHEDMENRKTTGKLVLKVNQE